LIFSIIPTNKRVNNVDASFISHISEVINIEKYVSNTDVTIVESLISKTIVNTEEVLRVK
jgi:hypothetical protein